MTTTVINREDVQKEVTIRYINTGQLSAVCIQPLSKAKIPAGTEVPASFLALNKKVQIIVTPDAVAPVKPAPIATLTTSPEPDKTVTVTTSSKN